MKVAYRIALLGSTALLAACGGGGGTPSPPATTSTAGQGTAPSLSQVVNFTVNVPPATGRALAKRKNASTVYISPAIASITFQLQTVNGTSLAHAPAPSQPTNIACPNPAAGCTVTVSGVVAAAGTDVFNVSTFSAPNGGGGVISSGLISVTVPAGGAGSASVGSTTTLSVGGYVASLTLSAVPNTVVIGTPSTATVIVTPKDAGGATIVGDVQFTTPITIAASDTTLTLSGPDLISNVVTLAGPEDANHPVTVAYGGQPTVGTLVATSADAAGNTVSSAPLTFAATVPTPPPTQTPSGGTTPVPLPTATRTPGAQSLYVLNGADNSIVEFAAPTSASPYPVRRFGGANVGCTAGTSTIDQSFQYGASGITVDPSGNVVVGNGPACQTANGVPGNANSPETLYEFAPSAAATDPPRSFTTKIPANAILTLAYNLHDGSFDVADRSFATGPQFANSHEPPAFVTRYRLQGSLAQPVGAYGNPQLNPSSYGCVVTNIAPFTAPCNAASMAPNTGALAVDYQATNDSPFALDPQGNTYLLAVPYVAGALAPANGALVVVPPQADSASPTALSAWYVAPPTFADQLIFQPLTSPTNSSSSFAVDGNTLIILEATNTSGFGPANCDPNPASETSTTPSSATCPDGATHAYLLKFDLTALFAGAPSNPGQLAAPLPTLVLGGASLPTTSSIAFGNLLAVGGGRIYIANGVHSGEIDVYDENLTGYHVEDSASVPSAKIVSPLVNLPIGVAYGQGGTATGGLTGAIRPRRLLR